MAEINGKMCKELREAMNEALEAVGKKFGLKIETKNMSYNQKMLNIKVEALQFGAEPTMVTDYKLHQKMFDLPKLGSSIKIKNGLFKIVGYKRKARKNTIYIEDLKGQIFVTSEATAKSCII